MEESRIHILRGVATSMERGKQSKQEIILIDIAKNNSVEKENPIIMH